MKRAGWLAACLTLAALLLSGCGPKSPSAYEPSQQECPVMGVPTRSSTFVDYQGKRIFFCCNNCARTFLAHVDKYMKEMALKHVHLQDAPPVAAPPTVRAAHPCSCTPGTERPGTIHAGERLCFFFANTLRAFAGETSESAREIPVPGVPQERAPPQPSSTSA